MPGPMQALLDNLDILESGSKSFAGNPPRAGADAIGLKWRHDLPTNHRLLLPIAVLAGLSLASDCLAQSDATGIEFFEKKIRPVLVEHCYECHSAEAVENKKLKGGLLLDSREGLRQGGDSGPVLVPGDSNKSLLLSLLRNDPKVGKMPPKGKLPDEIIADFEKWIELGAPDPREGKIATDKYKVDFDEARGRWAFQLPKRSAPPAVNRSAWPRNDIDRFLLAKQEELGLKSVADVEPRILLRRLYFDLIGLPPSPEQIADFLNDPSPQAVERVVDELLKSPRFGERWARHWLDVVRYGDDKGGGGFNSGPVPFAWRYRQYVIDSFNEDKPYDRFVAEQIAGDLLPHSDEESRMNGMIATGMQTMGPAIGNPEEKLDERVDVLGRAVWGMSIGCARCHDHKFDPIYRQDYAAFVGVFMNSKVAMRLPSAEDQDGAIANKEFEAALKIYLKPLQGLAQLQKDARSRMGRMAIPYVPSMTEEELLARVPDKSQVVVRQQSEGIAKARDQVVELFKKSELVIPPLVIGIKEETSPPRMMQLDKKSEKGIVKTGVPRGMIRVMVHGEFPEIDQKTQSGRLQVAEWAGSDRHPLTARVMVNRVWRHLFGRGIVASVDTFGATGDPPSHPELLDTLAVEFMSEGWSVKKLIRKIVLSRSYQLATVHDPSNADKDVDDKYYWRGRRRRLEAEAIRDALLAASSNLELGPPPIAMQVATLDAEMLDALDDRHRTVYLPSLRNNVQPLMRTFDGADPLLVTGARGSTNVPTQALFMLNSNLVLRQARRMAEHLLSDAQSADDAARIERMYLLALGRSPNEKEVQNHLVFLKDWREDYAFPAEESTQIRDSWAALCQAILATAEFRYVE